MTEIEALLARSEKYLNSASLLFNAEDYESCVSRIYYAMFYAVEALLLTKNIAVSSHGGIKLIHCNY